MATKLRGSQIITGSIPEAQFDAAFLTRMSGIDTSISTINTNKADITYVDTAISNLVDSSPETLNTLNELAAALGDDPNFATSISTELGLKATDADLTAEVNRATLAEGALSDRLDIVEGLDTTVGSIAYAVKVETDRALAAESGLGNRLTTLEGADTLEGSVAYAVKTETDRALAAEGALDTRLDTVEGDNTTVGSIAYAVKTETDRATGVETTLGGRLDTLEGDDTTVGSVAYDIKVETTRATGVETGLDTRISAIENDTTYIKESDIVKGATVTETPDGTRTAFTLTSGDTMLAGSVQVAVNGLEVYAGASEDWQLNGSNTGIVFNTAPQTGDKIRVHYFKG